MWLSTAAVVFIAVSFQRDVDATSDVRSYPTFTGHEPPGFTGQVDHRGCYKTVRGIDHSGFERTIRPFAAKKCFAMCQANGFHQAFLYKGLSFCYCGNTIMTYLEKIEDNYCEPCREDESLFCGGSNVFSLYDIYNDTTPLTLYPQHNVITTTSPEVSYPKISKDIKDMFEDEPLILLAGRKGLFSYNQSSVATHLHKIWDKEVDALDYHLARKEGFAISDMMLYRFALFLDDPKFKEGPTFLADMTRCPTFAVDWVHDVIFWPDCYSHHIYFSKFSDDKNHFEQEILVKPSEGAWAYDMVVDPYKGLLFWSSGASLWSCRLDGRGLTKVIPSFPVNKVSSLSLDLAATRVYFSGLDKHDKNTSKVYYTSYTGSVSHALEYEDYLEGKEVLSFGIFHHHIYYVRTEEGNSTVALVTKLDYNHVPDVILDIHRSDYDVPDVRHLKLVHPDLQSPGKEDVCTNYGCSHMCLVEASLPQCHCPYYFTLEEDNKTCYLNPGEEEEEPLVVRAALGLMLVLLVLLGAGVLLCICDKIWSQLHPNVVRLNIERTLGRSDGQHLI